MFNKKDDMVGFASGSTTLISKTTQLDGDLVFSGNLEVEGKIVGNVYADEGSDARVRILEQGIIEGEIRVPTVVINGHVTGDVHSSKHVELAAKAEVVGNVHYSVIEMVRGAQVNGKLVYGDAGESAAAAAPATPATPAIAGADRGAGSGSRPVEST